MDTWLILEKELNYYGIRLVGNKKCQFCKETGTSSTLGILRTIKEFTKEIKRQKKLLLFLWEEVIHLLKENTNEPLVCDEKMINLFIFSLKDMSKFLSCFDLNHSYFDKQLNSALNRDINSFSREQILKLPNYKISIDWVHRYIHKLMYICKLLSYVSVGQESIAKYLMKNAKGISGPWANLDLPQEERVWPFEDDYLFGREKDKKRQRRYRKGFENYNNGGSVGEGHYWREIRNEPYSWADRGSEDPYAHRSLLNR